MSRGAPCSWFGLVAIAVTAVAAQEPSPRLLVRQNVVAVDGLETAASFAGRGYQPQSVPLSPAVFQFGERLVDTAALEYVDFNATQLRRCAIDGKELWSVARSDLGLLTGNIAAHCVLTRDRLVLPAANGGLVGIDRNNGKVAWHRDGVAHGIVVADADCIAAAGSNDKQHRLVLLGLGNGAIAASCELAAAPAAIVPGPRGIAVATAAGVEVFDRAGPKAFAAAGAWIVIAGTDEGWLLAGGGELRVVGRDGTVCWSQKSEAWSTPIADRLAAIAVTDNVVVVGKYCGMADSGVDLFAFDARTGDPRWQRHVAELGVSHSKYHQDVCFFAFGSDLVVMSQAPGGDFLVVIDAASGRPRDRREFRR